ncbi:LOW QUALITY PROTEIN: Protocadherin Fat [Phytophthora megakarya]|uniref:Protocadherin Fat n=1 Tax=Phytophthora megakarya TaxID=4795 RepID=A0A225X4S0_9STRA|nr:LOW QUALITY PROTEIN: Protocadherin Fat [Phytophthora megakarya]
MKDPEGKALTFSITTSSTDGFAISDSQILYVNKSNTMSTINQALLSIEVSDGYNRVQILCLLNILAAAPPIQCMEKGLSLSVSENSVGATVGRVQFLPLLYSPSGYTLQNSLVPFTLNTTTGELVVNDLISLDYEQQSIYYLTFAIYYSLTDYIICPAMIRVLDVNEPPTCTIQIADIRENLIGYDKWVLQSSAVDPEHGFLTFAMNSNGTFYSNSSGSVFARDLSLINYEAQPYYELTVSVSDGVNTVQCPIVINIVDTNDCPQMLKQVRYVDENSAIGAFVGDAIFARDEDYSLHAGGRLTFSIDSDIFSIGKTSGILTVTNSSQLDYEVLQHVEIVVYISDDATEPCTSNSTVSVFIVNVNEPPSIVVGQVGSVLEFTKDLAQETSAAVLNVSAHDPDKGDHLSFTLLSSNTSYLFRIDSQSGSIFVSDARAFDFESRNLYYLDVIVTDLGGLSNTQQVEIRVVNINEAPVFKLFTGYINENSPVNTAILNSSDIIATDPEEDDVVYRINGTRTDLPFDIKNNKLIVSSSQLDFEVRTEYTFSIQACDSKELCSNTHFMVIVTDVNEPPVIFPSRISIDENAMEGALIGSPILASDPDIGQRLLYTIMDGDTYDLFGIQTCNGQLYVKRSNSLDYEQFPSYQIVVAVSDSGLPSLTSSATITIEIRDVNEAPIFTADYSIRAQTKTTDTESMGSLIGMELVTAIQSASQLTGFCRGLIDIAVGFSSVALCDGGSHGPYAAILESTFILRDDSTAAFRVLAGMTINAVFLIDQALYSPQSVFRPGVDLQYSDEVFVGKLHRGKHCVIMLLYSPSDSPISLEVLINTDGWKPISVQTFNGLVSQNIELSIAENSPPGTPVGNPIQAIDQDKGSKLYYSIVEQDSPALFRIEKDSGQLILNQNKSLDFETRSSYNLLVEVSDTELSTDVWVFVKVLDVNEPPVLSSPQTLAVKENSKAYTPVGRALTPLDPEGAAKKYSFELIPIDSAIPFELSTTTGQFFVAANADVDYETQTHYVLQVKITDDDGLILTIDVIINVIDINEAPVTFINVVPVHENAPQGTSVAQLQGSDPENQTIVFSYVSNFAGDANSTAFRVVYISPSRAQIEVRGAEIDFEQQRSFDMTVMVEDISENSLSTTQTFTVFVIDVNEPPQLTVPTPIYLSVPENTANSSFVGSSLVGYISDQDAGDTISIELLYSVPYNAVFNVTASGQVSVRNSALLNYEVVSLIELWCQAYDTGGNLINFSVNVDVTNVNEAPYFAESTVQINIPESLASGTEVHRVSGLDPDGHGDQLRYNIVNGNSSGAIALNDFGVLKSLRKFTAMEQFYILVEAVDNFGAGLPSITNQRLMISVSSVNAPPVVNNFVFLVNEDVEIGTKIGQVWGNDSYDGSVLSFFTVPDTDRIRFHAINRNTSDVYVWTPALDFETEPVITFVLCAMDDGARNDYISVMKGCGKLTISVVDVNEAPKFDVIAGNVRQITEAAQLEDGVAGGMHYTTSAGLFFGNNSHDLLSDEKFSFGFGELDFSTAMSIRTNTAGGNILHLREFTTNNYFEVSIGSDGTLNVSTNNSSTQGTRVLTDNVWHYVAIVYTISELMLRLYIDGNLETSSTFILGSPTIADEAVLSSSPNPFKGWISRFHYFAGAVSSDQVNELASYSVSLLYQRHVLAPYLEMKASLTALARTYASVTGWILNHSVASHSTVLKHYLPTAKNLCWYLLVPTKLHKRNKTQAMPKSRVARNSIKTLMILFIFVFLNLIDQQVSKLIRCQGIYRRWIDFETLQSLSIKAQVFDSLGLSDIILTRLDVVDANDAPKALPTTYKLAENPNLGSLIGKFVTESPETTEKLSAQIISSTCPFSIGRVSDQLVVENTTKFDFETNAVITCVILVTDDAPLPRSIYTTVTVQLIDVNEIPIIASGQRGYISENGAKGDLVMKLQAADPDTNPMWSSIRFDLINSSIFAVRPTTGDISVLVPGMLDFETNSEVTVQVRVTDGGFLTAETVVFISVLNEEEAPHAPEFYNLIVPENGVVPRSLLLVNATDPDRISQNKLIFTLMENAHEFSIDNITGELILLKPLDYEALPSMNLTVNIAKRGTSLNVNTTIYIVVGDLNEAPKLYNGTKVETTSQENMIKGSPVGVILSSYVWDPENNTLSYSLDASEFSLYFSLEGCAGQLRSVQPLDFESMPNKINLTVSVYDSSKARLSFPFSIFILDVNEPPIFDQIQYSLGVDENATSNTMIGMVAGSDPDVGNRLVYSLKSTAYAGVFKIDSATSEIFVSSTAVLDYETRTSYTFQVCATDGQLESCTSVLINVLDINEPPSCQPQSRFASENSGAGTVVRPSIESIDPDTKDLGLYPIFSLVDTERIGGFHFINSSIILGGLSLDFETRDVYHFQYSACDAEHACTTCNLTIHITDVNEPPVVLSQTIEVKEGTNTSFYTVQAYDPDFNQTGNLLYEIVDQSLSGLFSLEPGSGIIRAVDSTRLDFETVELHRAWINVRVTDTGIPPLSSTGHLVIEIQDVNEAPTSASTIDISIPENATVGTIALTWSAQDEDLGQKLTYRVISDIHTGVISFRDNGSPDITLEALLDYEIASRYEMTLQACDPYALCTTTLLQITVDDCNEPPSFIPETDIYPNLSVASHASSGTVLGVLQAADPDYGDVVAYSILSSSSKLTAGSKDGVGVFSVNQQTGEVKVDSSQSIQMLQAGYSFTLTAKVSDLKQLSAITTITVNVVADNAPPLCQPGFSFYMDENAAIGTLVGLPLSSYVTDADIGTTFVFSLQHPFLAINPSTGQLSVTCATNLDFESVTLNSTTASVVVTDDGALHNGLNTLSTSCIIFIAARDVNEVPQTTNLSLTIPEGTNSNPSRTLPNEMFTFPILSPQADYTVRKMVTGGYSINSSSKTLPLGYDTYMHSSIGVILRFEDVQLPSVIDHLSLAQLRLTIPSGKVGPFSLQIRVLNETSISWNSNQILESFGMPAFIQWTIDKEITASTIWSPSIATILDPVMSDILNTNTVALLITGGGVVPSSDPDALDSVRFAIIKGNPHHPVFFVDKTTGDISANIDLLDYEAQNSYELLISVTDRLGLSTLSMVNVAITDVNEPPVVYGRVCYVVENTLVGSALCAIGASDPDNSDLPTGTFVYYLANSLDANYTAFQIDPISGILLVANSTILNYEVYQQFVVTVCARDRGNPPLNGCDTVTIHITDTNDAPTTISPQTYEMDEYSYDLDDQQLSQLVGMTVCNLTVLDEDSTGVMNGLWKNHIWKIVQADPGCPFNVSFDGQIVVNDPRHINYEEHKIWSLLVQATDLGGLSSIPQLVKIIIRDINENPQIFPTTFYIDENSVTGTNAIGNLTIFDPDIDIKGQHERVVVGVVGEVDMFDVVNNKIQVMRDGLDFETKALYVISVVATDESDAKSIIQNINIVINDINEAPIIEPIQLSIKENQLPTTKLLPGVRAADPEGSTISFSMISETPKGAASGAPIAFGIDFTTGILFQQVDKLDFEVTNEYVLVVKAQDRTGLFSTATITVTVIDVNEPPSIRGQTVTVRENTNTGTLVGQPYSNIVSDPDIKNGYEVLTYTLLFGNHSVFIIDSQSGQVTTAAPLDFETKSVYNLSVRVTDYDGLYDDADFTVMLIDINEPPTISPFNITVPENLIPGSAVGNPVLATDPDAGSILQYDLGETSVIVRAYIRIDTFSGQLSLKSDSTFDYESSIGTTLPVMVRVSDGDFTVSTNGTIFIADVNEYLTTSRQ